MPRGPSWAAQEATATPRPPWRRHGPRGAPLAPTLAPTHHHGSAPCAPQAEAVSAVLWCCADGEPSRAVARAISTRYVGWAKLHFGAQHASVLTMAALA